MESVNKVLPEIIGVEGKMNYMMCIIVIVIQAQMKKITVYIYYNYIIICLWNTSIKGCKMHDDYQSHFKKMKNT